MTLDDFNALDAERAAEELARCCGAAAWVTAMNDRRPYADRGALFAAARETWRGLGAEGWKEAFRHHPKIGDVAALKKKFAATAKWAAGEQAGAAAASRPVLQALADKNAEYEARYGWIFIVCATGKSAGEMLHILNERLGNEPEKELRIAAEEQAKITLIRLEKLLS